ncbi:MAG: 50S ribosomal protein L21 [Nitrospirota bacterium]
MYAIIENGGKQYKAVIGGIVRTQKMPLTKGQDVILDKVLMINEEGKSTFGSPYVEGAKVTALVEDVGKSTKVMVFKQKPRKGYRKLRGHRQPYTTLRIKEIVRGG